MKKAGKERRGEGKTLFLLVLFAAFILLVLVNSVITYQFLKTTAVTAKATSQANIQLTVEGAAPTPTPTPTPSPGGEGGGGAAPSKSFILDKAELKVKLKQGESAIKTFAITNNGEVLLDFKIEIEKLKDYITLSKSSFILASRNSETISLIFSIPEIAEPGVYTGKIIVFGDSIKKIVNVILEIVTERVLFDVKVDIPKQFKEVLPGEEVSAQVTILNLGEVAGENATIIYKIMDMESNIILENTSMQNIETQFSYVVSFVLPKTIQFGTYIFAAEVLYEDSVATASDTFDVVAELEFPLRKDYVIYIIIFLVILIFIIIMYLNYRKLRKIEKKHKKLREKFETEE